MRCLARFCAQGFLAAFDVRIAFRVLVFVLEVFAAHLQFGDMPETHPENIEAGDDQLRHNHGGCGPEAEIRHHFQEGAGFHPDHARRARDGTFGDIPKDHGKNHKFRERLERIGKRSATGDALETRQGRDPFEFRKQGFRMDEEPCLQEPAPQTEHGDGRCHWHGQFQSGFNGMVRTVEQAPLCHGDRTGIGHEDLHDVYKVRHQIWQDHENSCKSAKKSHEIHGLTGHDDLPVLPRLLKAL